MYTCIEWKEDLVLGCTTIWASLALGNILTVFVCIVYLKTRINWMDAANQSTMIMQRIESLSSLQSMGQPKINQVRTDFFEPMLSPFSQSQLSSSSGLFTFSIPDAYSAPEQSNIQPNAA